MARKTERAPRGRDCTNSNLGLLDQVGIALNDVVGRRRLRMRRFRNRLRRAKGSVRHDSGGGGCDHQRPPDMSVVRAA